MGFVGVYRAVYDYHSQAQNELELHEGDLLYVLEKSSEDGWWQAKKRATDDDDDEPEGLIPNNYIEEVRTGSPRPTTLLTVQSSGPQHSQCTRPI